MGLMRSTRRVAKQPVRPAQRDERESPVDPSRYVMPGCVERDGDAEEAHRMPPRRHEAAEIRAHGARSVTAEVALLQKDRRDEKRRKERDDQTRRKSVPPEEIYRDEGCRCVGEELRRMDLVIENALAEAQGVFATSLP